LLWGTLPTAWSIAAHGAEALRMGPKKEAEDRHQGRADRLGGVGGDAASAKARWLLALSPPCGQHLVVRQLDARITTPESVRSARHRRVMGDHDQWAAARFTHLALQKRARVQVTRERMWRTEALDVAGKPIKPKEPPPPATSSS
jgi:hypothetical protein